MLGISTKQVHRFLVFFREGGGAMIHKAGGRALNNHSMTDMHGYVVELVRTRYADFGPSLTAEVLLEKDGAQVSRETLRKWMVEAGLWLSRKLRSSFLQPRLRRESYGELVQIDGSDHRVFKSRAKPCTLLVFIDNTTG